SGKAYIDSNVVIKDSAKIYGSAYVSSYDVGELITIQNNAKVFGEANIGGSATIQDSAQVSGQVNVYENAIIGGTNVFTGDAIVRGSADFSTGSTTYTTGLYFGL
ncbi:MAG: hypothetical protein CO099_06970, partial [Bdellovibrio sp. CG_4_9_14_3_um_filter_39_7]